MNSYIIFILNLFYWVVYWTIFIINYVDIDMNEIKLRLHQLLMYHHILYCINNNYNNNLVKVVVFQPHK